MTVGPSILACGQVNKKVIRNIPYKDSCLIYALHANSEVEGFTRWASLSGGGWEVYLLASGSWF